MKKWQLVIHINQAMVNMEFPVEEMVSKLKELGYKEKLSDSAALNKALYSQVIEIEYANCIAWITQQVHRLGAFEDQVHDVVSPDDYPSFMLELSSLLKEMQCPYVELMKEGSLEERFTASPSVRVLLIDYLCGELCTAKICFVNRADKRLKVEMEESSTARDLRLLLEGVGLSMPAGIIATQHLLSKIEAKLQEKTRSKKFSEPLFSQMLAKRHWDALEALNKQFFEDYRSRRQTLIARADVTVQSFKWADRMKGKQDEITRKYMALRQEMSVEPGVQLGYILAARSDILVVEKTSCAAVRENTKSKVNFVLIGQVPDRGGRPEEAQPPPPEMPPWQKREAGDDFRGGGRGGYQGGRGGGGGYHGGGGNSQQGGGYHQGGDNVRRNIRVQGAGWYQGESRGGNRGGYRGGYRGGGGRSRY